MAVNTALLGLPLPEVGSDDDAWGDFLNAALQMIEDKLAIPVGGLFLSAVATNPATLLGYGTWAPHAAGRALVGVGDNGTSTWTGGELRGAETHTLIADEVPAHSHGAGALVTGSGGAHSHSFSGTTANRSLTGSFESRQNVDDQPMIIRTTGVFSDGGEGSGTRRWQRETIDRPTQKTNFNATHNHSFSGTTNSDGAHSHSVTGTTADAGGGTAHNNVQPSIGVYVWRRTA